MKGGNVKTSDPNLFFGNISRTKTVFLRSILNRTSIDWLDAEWETLGKPRPDIFRNGMWSLCIHAYIHKVWSIVQFIGGSQIHFFKHPRLARSLHPPKRSSSNLFFFLVLVWEIIPKNRLGSLLHTKNYHISYCIPIHAFIVAHITRIYA